jgi:uncharacterized protein
MLRFDEEMKYRIITPAEYRVLPWKNGRGVTTEFVIEPPDSNFQSGDFLWRISSARVLEKGPFSQFPGFDRILIVLEGKELRILKDSGEFHKLHQFDALSFHGEEIIESEPSEDGVLDLNIFFRRNLFQVNLHRIEDRSQFSCRSSIRNFLYAHGQDAMIFHSGKEIANVRAGAIMELDYQGMVDVIPDQGGCVFGFSIRPSQI